MVCNACAVLLAQTGVLTRFAPGERLACSLPRQGAGGNSMDSNFRRACLCLLGVTFQIVIKDGQPVVVITT